MIDAVRDQLDLLSWQPPRPGKFLGATFDSARDEERLSKQLKAVHDVMKDGQHRSLRQMADAAGCPEASASARFRDLKRLGFPMQKKNEGRGTWIYWMGPPE